MDVMLVYHCTQPVIPPDQRQGLTHFVKLQELGKPVLFPGNQGRFSCKGLHNTVQVKDGGKSESHAVMAWIVFQDLTRC
jgi:hypothetical protein